MALYKTTLFDTQSNLIAILHRHSEMDINAFSDHIYSEVESSPFGRTVRGITVEHSRPVPAFLQVQA